MERAKWDYDFRETTLKGYFDIPDDPNFTEIHMHRIGTWYASKLDDYYFMMRLRTGRNYHELFF